MVSCHIAHDCKIGDHNIFANNTLLNGHVIVQEHNQELCRVPAVGVRYASSDCGSILEFHRLET
ncbi:hypothetical protein YC2023_007919 [Brassica napus]